MREEREEYFYAEWTSIKNVIKKIKLNKYSVDHVRDSNKSSLFVNKMIPKVQILLLLVPGLDQKMNERDISNTYHKACEKLFNDKDSLKQIFIGEALQIVGQNILFGIIEKN